MIQANDLRIGNTVFEHIGLSLSNTFWQNIHNYEIKRLTAIDIVAIENGFRDWFDPIPLTPEILEKNCGFFWMEKHRLQSQEFNWKEDERTCLCFIVEDNTIKHLEIWQIHDFGVPVLQRAGHVKLDKVKYLHQLQNIYYDLIGEELNVQQ